MTGTGTKTITFQLKLPENINRLVLSAAAMSDKNKHEWIEKAVQEKLERDKAV